MKILALDCSTEACSVALLSETAGQPAEIVGQFELAARQHTQRILPLVDQVLAGAGVSLKQLDAIAFGRGPGSFTGLRICLGAVQGLAYGADLPVVPISTLAAQAQTYINAVSMESALTENEVFAANGLIISTLDARMDEVYWGVYRQLEQGVELVGDECLTTPELLLSGHNIDRTTAVAVGSGYNYVARVPQAQELQRWYGELLPTAAAVAQLALIDFKRGLSCHADQALPIYLRDEVAWQKQTPQG
ncbi:MAG: tRNA (adenosine(37)-N6)-threonylcarbamoyltransferase complex dimerization subunit type 1 TsaB [Spongiibacteraceae bacterium]